MKVVIRLDIPDNNCYLCQFYGYYKKTFANGKFVEKHFCKLFNDCELIQINGEFARCVACQSCAEVQK